MSAAAITVNWPEKGSLIKQSLILGVVDWQVAGGTCLGNVLAIPSLYLSQF
jgi:hypothetical protein